MSLTDKLKKDTRDFVKGVPDTKKELVKYMKDYYKDISERCNNNPSYEKALYESIESVLEKIPKYDKGLVGKTAHYSHEAGRAVGYSADGWVLGTGDIVGALGGKFIGSLMNIFDAGYGVAYGVKNGQYLAAGENLIRKAISYIPGLTFMDKGMKNIVNRKRAKKIKYEFNKKINNLENYVKSSQEEIQKHYKTEVKNRTANIFKPIYTKAA